MYEIKLIRSVLEEGAMVKVTTAKDAVDMVADGVILVHNHPSGNSKPSSADINQTKDVRNGLKCLDIKLLDHIIIADDEFYSFAGEQVMKR